MTASLRPRVILLGLCSLVLLAAATSKRGARPLHASELIIQEQEGGVAYRLALEGDVLVMRRLDKEAGQIRFVVQPEVTAIELMPKGQDDAQARMWINTATGAGIEFQTGPGQPSARLASSAEGAELALRGPEWGGAVIAEVNREANGGRLQLGDKGPAVRLSPKAEGMKVEALYQGAWTVVDELP